jgi:hypothetical protein
MDKQRAKSARIVVAGALALALAGMSAPLQVTPDAGDRQVAGAFAWGEIAFAQGNSDNSNAGGNGDGGNGNSPDQSNAGGNGTDQGGGDGTPPGHGGGNSSDGRGGGDQTSEPQKEMGPSLHPSGKDRTEEPGGSGTQGRSPSDPDGDFNYGPDKPRESGGIYTGDQDGNNGCGNDQDFEDDNRGNCGGPARGGNGGPVVETPDTEDPVVQNPDEDNTDVNTPGGIVGGIDGGTGSGGNPSNGGNGSNGSGGNGSGGNSVSGVNDSTPIGIADSFTAVQAQSLSVAAEDDESVDLTPSVNGLSVESARSVVDVPEPSASHAAPIAGNGAAVGGPVVAALPATGIGLGSLSSSAGSLLMLIASGLSALGALGTRRSWGQSR